MRIVWFLLALACLCASSPAGGFGELLNPTGDPIGGGPGYRDIVMPDKVTAVVETRAGLIEALAQAKPGSIIYVRDDAAIDMTGADNQTVPGGVTLASGRGRGKSQGALLFSMSLTDEAKFIPLFKTGGRDVRITGLRLRGPFAEVGDHHYDQVKIANGIRADHPDLQVDNCELWAWDKWAIDLAVAGGAHVHHNYIHHTRRWGYGYGVWVRGGGMALIEANLFDFCRHSVAAGAQADSSYEARYNICLNHDVLHTFDRHGDETKAGFTTLIHHNEFRDPDVSAIALRGTPLGEARFHHNWFSHESEKLAIPIPSYVKKNVFIYDNEYGPATIGRHPIARATSTPTTGRAPLTVEFDASGSTDNEGQIIGFRWNFPDTPDAVGVEAHTPQARYTFKDPGRYNVGLTVWNQRGIPATLLVPVHVTPAQEGFALSAWVKDSYSGPLHGYYRKQILIDGKVIWEQDVADDAGGWQHLVLDVSKYVRNRKAVELSFRLRADKDITDPAKQIVECFYYIDDVHLFGGSVLNGDFENNESWMFETSPSDDTGFHLATANLWTGEARSGTRCCVLGNGYGRKIRAGAYTEVKQKVAVKEAAAR